MMIPIPGRGFFRGVSGVEAARAVGLIEDVVVTARPGQLLVPLPEGSSYFGFIFARGDRATDVDRALRTAHSCLEFSVTRELRMVESRHG
jgi:hypothetical protein